MRIFRLERLFGPASYLVSQCYDKPRRGFPIRDVVRESAVGDHWPRTQAEIFRRSIAGHISSEMIDAESNDAIACCGKRFGVSPSHATTALMPHEAIHSTRLTSRGTSPNFHRRPAMSKRRKNGDGISSTCPGNDDDDTE